METRTAIESHNLSFSYGTLPVLENVSFSVPEGSYTALIGANGAGKSTLLKLLLGELTPTSGSLSLLGQPIRSFRDWPRIGYVPQSPNFAKGDPISVLDLFCCCIGKRPAFLRPRAAMREKVLQCLSNVDAESLIDRRVGALSGGELQRVLLALALEPMPNMLILDEPLSGVDVEGMALLMDMLDGIRKKFDLSILMTTHDFSMLEKYADRVVLLRERVLCEGTPEQVLSSDAFAEVFHMRGGKAQ